MQIILLPVAGDPTVSIAFSFAVGSHNDPPGKAGLAALTAAMLTEGATGTHSYEAILERLYPLATDYAATVDKELTTIDGRAHRDTLDEFVPLLLDAILRPAFAEHDFERLTSDAINFIDNTLRYSSDEALGKAGLTAAIFAGTPYAHPVEGRIAGLKAITLADIRAFHATHFTQAKLTLAIGGGYDDALVARLELAAATLPVGSTEPAQAVDAPVLSGRRVVLIDKAGADASVSFGFPLAVSRGERDYYALAVANSWLGEHRHGASRLFQLIRETRGLNYGDYSYIEAFPDAGERQMPPVNCPRRRQLFEVWIRTLPNEQAVFALRCALRELDRLIEQGLTPEQFELTRNFLKKYSTHYAPTTFARLGYAIDDAFYGIGPEGHLERFDRTMSELTHAEVNAAVRRHWQTDDLVIAIVTGDADGLERSFTSGEPTPLRYSNPMPAEVLSEDEAIAAYPLGAIQKPIDRWPAATIFD